ncbi:MAG: oligosaccharide flippase family protein [Thermaerobacter sp.]|nr:oligosaccharide flippase family protein [Thermaerobacter sp.]
MSDESSARTTATLRVMSWTLAGKLAGVLRGTLIAALLGAGVWGDAYAAAVALPNALSSLLNQALSTVTVPYFHEQPEEAPQFLSALTRLVLIVLVPTAFLLAFLAPLYLPHVFAGRTPGGERDAAEISWFFDLMLVPLALASVWTGRLNAARRFVPLSATNLVRSGSTLLLILALAKLLNLGLLGVASAFLGGSLLQLLYLAPATAPFQRPSAESWRRVWAAVRLMPSQITSSIVGQVNFLVDQAFASTLSTGSIFELTNAGGFLELPVSLFGQSLATVLFPDFADHAKNKDPEGLVRSVDRALYLTWVATLPIAALLIGLSRPVTAVVFGYGRYSQPAVAATAGMVAAYAGSLIFRTMQQFVIRAFYVYKNTSILARVSLAAMLLNAGLDYLLMQVLRGPGIALATTIVGALYFLVTLIMLERLLLQHHAIGAGPYLTAMLAALPLAPIGYLLSHVRIFHGRLEQLALVVVAAVVLGALYVALLRIVGGRRGKDATDLLRRLLLRVLRREHN